jgi:hypothetical protein
MFCSICNTDNPFHLNLGLHIAPAIALMILSPSQDSAPRKPFCHFLAETRVFRSRHDACGVDELFPLSILPKYVRGFHDVPPSLPTLSKSFCPISQNSNKRPFWFCFMCSPTKYLCGKVNKRGLQRPSVPSTGHYEHIPSAASECMQFHANLPLIFVLANPTFSSRSLPAPE